jgi:Helix-turn-helix domain
MSIDAINWAWGQPCSATQKLVLVALADHADHHGSCYPSIGRVASRCGLSRRAVQKAIRGLESARLLSTQPKTGSRHTYALNLRTPIAGERETPVNGVPTPGEYGSLPPANRVHGRGEPRSPKPPLTHSKPSFNPQPRRGGFQPEGRITVL